MVATIIGCLVGLFLDGIGRLRLLPYRGEEADKFKVCGRFCATLGIAQSWTPRDCKACDPRAVVAGIHAIVGQGPRR